MKGGRAPYRIRIFGVELLFLCCLTAQIVTENTFKMWQLLFKCHLVARLSQYSGIDDKSDIKK